MTRRIEICIDVNDPDAVRPFWQAALAYPDHTITDGDLVLRDPAGQGPTVWFQKVPESKTVKNRVHLDIWLDSEDQVTELSSTLEGLGGTQLTGFDDFIVVADPEGNELCLIWPD